MFTLKWMNSVKNASVKSWKVTRVLLEFCLRNAPGLCKLSDPPSLFPHVLADAAAAWSHTCPGPLTHEVKVAWTGVWPDGKFSFAQTATLSSTLDPALWRPRLLFRKRHKRWFSLSNNNVDVSNLTSNWSWLCCIHCTLNLIWTVQIVEQYLPKQFPALPWGPPTCLQVLRQRSRFLCWNHKV